MLYKDLKVIKPKKKAVEVFSSSSVIETHLTVAISSLTVKLEVGVGVCVCVMVHA